MDISVQIVHGRQNQWYVGGRLDANRQMQEKKVGNHGGSTCSVLCPRRIFSGGSCPDINQAV